jgi:putative endonuclease
MAASVWFVYMILTDKGRLYTGIATDVARRLREHQDVAGGVVNARGAKYFRSQTPMQVVYVEAFADRPQALRRERLIKGMTAVQKRRLCAEQAADVPERANPALID